MFSGDGLGLVAAGSGAAKIQSSTATGSQHNWAPGGAGSTLLLWSGGANLSVTGIAGGVAGTLLFFKNIGTAIATFAHQSGSSALSHRLQNLATLGPTPVAAGGWITYLHTGTTWQLVGHDQGAWITPPFAAGDFTGSGSMTWTVDAGDVQTDRYRLEGTRAIYQASYNGTSVGGTPATQLIRALPAVLTPKVANEVTVTWSRNQDNGTPNDGFCYTFGTAGVQLHFRRDKTSGAWAVSTNNTEVQCTHLWEVG